MATMISEVYTAFKKAGVPEQEAVSAAETLATESSASKKDINQLEITFKSDVGKLADKIARTDDKVPTALFAASFLVVILDAAILVFLFRKIQSLLWEIENE